MEAKAVEVVPKAVTAVHVELLMIKAILFYATIVRVQVCMVEVTMKLMKMETRLVNHI